METISFNSVQYGVKYDHLHFPPNKAANRNKLSADLSKDDAKAIRIHEEYDRAVEMGQVRRFNGNLFLPLLCGMTRCQIIDGSKNILAEGFSFCSITDNFEKRKGRKIAFGRALHAFLKA